MSELSINEENAAKADEVEEVEDKSGLNEKTVEDVEFTEMDEDGKQFYEIVWEWALLWILDAEILSIFGCLFVVVLSVGSPLST